MGEGNLPWLGDRPAADEAGVADGVVRGAEGAGRHQGLAGTQ